MAAQPTITGNILGPQANGATAITSSTQQVGVFIPSGKALVGGTGAGAGDIIAHNDDPPLCPSANTSPRR
ncbi:MAG TPA: hypothetical protein VIC60_13850 [Thermomicrobiales bacterium]